MPGERRRTAYTPLAEVQRAYRNPKKHDAALIAGSMVRFGVVELPAVDERTGRLVAGHGRLDDWIARKAAGEQPPDGIDIDPDSGDWMVPVTRGWSSRSDADAEAYVVVSNQSTIAGGWDNEPLAQLLADLRDQDPDLLNLTGFDDKFISRHWEGDTSPWDRDLPDPDDDGPPVKGTPVIVVVCADATEQIQAYTHLQAGGYTCRMAVWEERKHTLTTSEEPAHGTP